MFNQIGPLELGIVLVIVLLIFGPKRLPGLGKQLGTGMREFKDSITGDKKHDEDPADITPSGLPSAPAAAPVPPASAAPAPAPAEETVTPPAAAEQERARASEPRT
jgi:sec-independent protein translocase protein TatA